jgi:hypothetical protein
MPSLRGKIRRAQGIPCMAKGPTASPLAHPIALETGRELTMWVVQASVRGVGSRNKLIVGSPDKSFPGTQRPASAFMKHSSGA